MLFSKDFPRQEPVARFRRRLHFTDPSFQLKYTKRVLGIVVAASLFYAIPLFYLVNENYNYLTKLAYSLSPNLARHIEGEQVMFNIAIAGIILSHWLVIILFGRKMTEKIVVPIKKMHNQLRMLTRGQLSGPQIRIRQDDEFHDLISGFNYYHSGLKEDTRRDMLKLQKIREGLKPSESLNMINEMIHERATQLSEIDEENIIPIPSAKSSDKEAS
jgi:hypothetical protein